MSEPVPRPRLTALLDDGVRRALTLVLAGPGWGKTAVVSSWADASGRTVARLTLGAEHRTFPAFGSALVAAITGACDRRPASLEDLMRELAPALADRPTPAVLVLDDLEAIDDSEAMARLAALLGRMPAWLRLIALTRTEPALPLHRLRAAGELAEIGPRELAFDRDEAAELLGCEHAADELLAVTEGWALGFRLEGDGVRDYLLHEVVAAEPPAVRDFLRRTSVPDLVSAGLAGALTGAKHGGQILDRLQRTSGFVTRLAPGSPWFRYHPQLRAALRWQLDLEDPDTRPDLHRAAARWYAAKHSVAAALAHASAAGDWAYLGRLVATQGVVLIVTSDRRLLVEALRRIPPEQFGTTAELMFCAVLLRFASGDYPGLLEPLARLRDMLAGRDPVQRMAIELAVSVLEAAAVVRVRGDMPALVRVTTDILERINQARLDHVPALLQLRALALNNKGVGLFWTNRLDQADRYLWAGLSGARVAGLQLVEINARAHLGLLAFLQGSLAEADEHVTAARGIAARHDLESTPQAMGAHLALALIELERNHIADAQAALRQALHSEANPPEAALAAVASLVRVNLLLAADDPVAAGAVLQAARQEAGPAVVAPLLERWLLRCAAEVALAQQLAERVVAHYTTGETMLNPAEQVCLGRAYLDLGQQARAEEFLTRAANGPDMVSAVTAWIALALLADAQGHVNRSINAMSRAATLARRNGIRRPFRKFGGAPIAGLLSRQRWMDDDDGFAMPELPDPAEVTAEPGAALAEPLSERERDVLRFLPTVLTAHEIAQNLGISVNTVKAHMRAIYRKLDAARRRDAVIMARRHGLLYGRRAAVPRIGGDH